MLDENTFDSSAGRGLGAARNGEPSKPVRSSWGLPSRLICLVLIGLLEACGGGGSDQGAGTSSSQAAGTPTGARRTPTSPQGLTGHYVGAVGIAGTNYFGDAVVTHDGALRLYIGGPYDDGGELQTAQPESSEQFVGTLQMRNGQWTGSGVVIGQECAIHAANRFCAEAVPAEFSATVSLVSGEAVTASLQGQIQMVTSGNTETWSLNLGLWGDNGPLESGQFQEVLAEFASGGDLIVSLDDGGKLFFQSSGSGCVGNGTWTPHSAGPADIYDVTLTIDSCSGTYAYLNGNYGGLALSTPDSVWDYDSELRIWISKDAQTGAPAALTMLGELL